MTEKSVLMRRGACPHLPPFATPLDTVNSNACSLCTEYMRLACIPVAKSFFEMVGNLIVFYNF